MRSVRLIAAVVFSLFIIVIIIQSNRGGCDICRIVKAIPLGDKVGHAGLFGLLVFLIGIARTWRVYSWKSFLFLSSSMILAIAVALEEVSQSFFASRTADPWDLVASWIGVYFGDRTARRFRMTEREDLPKE